MVKFVSLALLYTSALVAQTVALSLRQESSNVVIFLFSVMIDLIQMYSFDLIKSKSDIIQTYEFSEV